MNATAAECEVRHPCLRFKILYNACLFLENTSSCIFCRFLRRAGNPCRISTMFHVLWSFKETTARFTLSSSTLSLRSLTKTIFSTTSAILGWDLSRATLVKSVRNSFLQFIDLFSFLHLHSHTFQIKSGEIPSCVIVDSIASNIKEYDSCSKRGKCDYVTGMCDCYVSFTGYSCGTFETEVMLRVPASLSRLARNSSVYRFSGHKRRR